jgi:hypothetical protein
MAMAVMVSVVVMVVRRRCSSAMAAVVVTGWPRSVAVRAVTVAGRGCCRAMVVPVVTRRR